MFLKRLWLLLFILNFLVLIFFWFQPEAHLATRFDFHGNPTRYQDGREFAHFVALLLFLFNGLLVLIDFLALKPGFAELTNIPNKAYWVQNKMLVAKLKELLSIQALWINVMILAILGYTADANNHEPNSLQLHSSFIFFLVLMVMALVISIFVRTRKSAIPTSFLNR